MLNKCTLLALTAIALFVVVPAHAVHVQPVCFAGAPSTIPSCLRGRATIVGGNWKCNPAETAKLPELVANFGPCADLLDKCDVYVCPSNLHVGMIYKDFAPGIMVAPQNCNFQGCGAYTGEMAVDQMVDMGLKVRNTRHACTHTSCSYPH
ncbi:MAG: triose-phosphate isomerase, partial [Promethearchaeia archaeon]